MGVSIGDAVHSSLGLPYFRRVCLHFQTRHIRITLTRVHRHQPPDNSDGFRPDSCPWTVQRPLRDSDEREEQTPQLGGTRRYWSGDGPLVVFAPTMCHGSYRFIGNRWSGGAILPAMGCGCWLDNSVMLFAGNDNIVRVSR